MKNEKTTRSVEGLSEAKDYEFRLLDANEIEVRVGQGGNAKSPSWCSLLLYKDARCDMKRLDEKFGIFGWQRKHEIIGQNLYCTVSVRANDGTWVSKQDVGTPSNTEAIKGQSSDAFKRACYCLGIGRELYTSPKIGVRLNPQTEYSQNGRLLTTFHVSYIEYNNRKISKLIIQDQNNYIRYYFGMTEQEAQSTLASMNNDNGFSEPAPTQREDEAQKEQKHYAYPQLEQASLWEEVDKVWSEFPDLQSLEEFKEKCIERKMQLAQSRADLKAIYDQYPAYQQNPNFLAKLTQYKSILR